MSQSYTVLRQLRDGLAGDLKALKSMSLRDWARSIVDLSLSAGLVCRSAIYSCVYAVNYGKPGAEISTSLWQAPLRAPDWTRWDRLQAASGSVAVAIWLLGNLTIDPEGALINTLVAGQAAVLGYDGAAAVLEVLSN